MTAEIKEYRKCSNSKQIVTINNPPEINEEDCGKCADCLININNYLIGLNSKRVLEANEYVGNLRKKKGK